MTREEKLETIVKLFAKAMFYGDWEWESPNERVITMLMQEVGMYPFKNEDDMITQIMSALQEELNEEEIKAEEINRIISRARKTRKNEIK